MGVVFIIVVELVIKCFLLIIEAYSMAQNGPSSHWICPQWLCSEYCNHGGTIVYVLCDYNFE